MGGREETRFHAIMRGYNEVPANASQARGRTTLTVGRDDATINFAIEYSDLSGPPTVAHVHFGARATNGGVTFFFCGGGGKPACPTGTSGTISGTVQAADVLGPVGQGIDPGALPEVLRAIRRGVTYSNIHSAKYPAGEIRGQIFEGRRGDDERDDFNAF
ncbi:CHRD domain-containing protein [Pendulispora albinea]|uniref:CHRD domain-containing protein n=1 Tax=Pendulispora albinea TaxID=2741071 RepID=A0ABZ2LL29_9BACT